MALSTRRTPLLHCTNPHPLDVLDAGVRTLPVLPLHRHSQRQKKQETNRNNSQGRERDEATETRSQEAWAMTNERGRAPWFCANDIRCILPPSSTLLPYMFDDAIALQNMESFGGGHGGYNPDGSSMTGTQQNNFAGMVQQFDRKIKVDVIPSRKTNKSVSASKRANARALSRTSSSASSSAAAAATAAAAASSNAIATAATHEMDEDMIDTQQSFPDLSSIPLPTSFLSPDIDSPSPTTSQAPSNPFGLSVQGQLEYFERGLATKRLRSSEDPHTASKIPLSDRTSAGGRSTVSGAEFFMETSNHIPTQLLRQLLEEEQILAKQEEKEDLDGEKLAVIHVYPPSTPTSVDSYGVAPAYALLPGGALLEELTLAAVYADANHIITTHHQSSSLTMNIVHSLSLDSTIRQILLTTPPPKSSTSATSPSARASSDQADDREGSIQTPDRPILPLIVSRTTYQFYVHSIVFNPCNEILSQASTITSALVPSLFSIDYHSFRSPIVDMSSNPHIPNEVSILLQDGSIFVWNLFGVSGTELQQIQWEKNKQDIIHNRKPNQSPKKQTIATSAKIPSQRKLTCFPPGCYLPPSASLQTPLRWGRILFAHTPRVLILVLTNSVWQIDIRAPYQSSTHGAPCRGKQLQLPPLALKPFQSYSSPALREHDTRENSQPRIYAASICPSNRFHLLLISTDFILLCDTRHEGLRRPLLSWFHHQSGEPPAVIHWTSFQNTNGDSRHVNINSCTSCSQDDVYFFTNNRQRNEVTLYHYSMSAIPKPTITSEFEKIQLHGSTSAFSSYTPIRIPSLLHAEQSQRAGHPPSVENRVDFDLPNPLAGLAILPSTAFLHQPQQLASNICHIMQLSKYGAVVTQSFQHLHDSSSTATFATILPLAGRTEDESPSTANGYASPERKPSRQALMVLVNEPNAPSASSTTSPNLSLSPTSAFKSSTTAALPPWIQTHELKPFHKVNLMNLVTTVSGKLSTPGNGPLKRLSPPRSSPLSDAPAPPVLSRASFTHFLASVIHSFSSSAALHAYLSLPKTLSEISVFAIHEKILDPLLLQSLIGRAPSNDTQPKRSTRSNSAKPSYKDEEAIGAREMHAVAQIVYCALHAFVFLYQQDSSGNRRHEPYHVEQWSKNIPADAGNDMDQSIEPLDPSSPEFPQPSYPLFHFHLSLTRGKSIRESAEGVKMQNAAEEDEKGEEQGMDDDQSNASDTPQRTSRKRKASNNLDFSTCHCSSLPTSINAALSSASACCCHPLCQCIHCLRLDACVYCTSPSVLHMAWPTPPQRGLAFDDAAGADSQLDRHIQVSLEPFQHGSSQLRTPHRPNIHSNGVLSSSPASLNGPTVDLSQDIGFLMSQSESAESDNTLTQHTMRDSGKISGDKQTTISSHDRKQFDSHTSNMDDVAALESSPNALAEEQDTPPDPHALQDMLAGMAESWQRAEELAERIIRQRRMHTHPTLYPSSGSDAGDEDDSTLDISSFDAQLAELNAANLTKCLVTNGLAIDPAMQSQASEIGDDMRASMFDDMDDHGGGDGDD